VYGSGKKRRDFIYIDDINDFHVQCIHDKRTNFKTFNLGSGKNYSVNEVYEVISNLLGLKIAPQFKGDLEGESEITLADISLARELGWEPKINLDEGLARSIDYIKKFINL
jgi:UDP-glucose 4-epimerase